MVLIDDLAPIHGAQYRLQERLSVQERISLGKQLRQIYKRSHHDYVPAANRPDPLAILEAQAKTRVASLVPLRYARMLTSPFAFLRGAAAIMIQDIAPRPTTGITVQACGDMHLANFGVYASAERSLVFGINDFDETYPAPWEWDLKRLVASGVVAARYLGGDRAVAEATVRAMVRAYQTHLQEYATLGYLDLWYANITAEGLLETLPGNLQKPVDEMMAKARRRNHLQVLANMTDLVDDQKHIVESPPLVVRVATLGQEEEVVPQLQAMMLSYFSSLGGDRRFLLSRYRVVDLARKVVGVGSVGTRCWVVYLEGKNDDDPLFLQVKEAQPSVLASYSEARCGYRLPDHNQGRRVVIGQRLIQGAPDIFLGWGEHNGMHYYVRQLRDMKGSLKLEQGKFKPSALPDYGSVCGWALALAHAKSGDAALLAGYVGTGDALADGLVTFAEAYADQTERDYDTLTAAARQGRIPVAEG